MHRDCAANDTRPTLSGWKVYHSKDTIATNKQLDTTVSIKNPDLFEARNGLLRSSYPEFGMGDILLTDLLQNSVRHVVFVKVDQLFDEIIVA